MCYEIRCQSGVTLCNRLLRIVKCLTADDEDCIAKILHVDSIGSIVNHKKKNMWIARSGLFAMQDLTLHVPSTFFTSVIFLLVWQLKAYFASLLATNMSINSYRTHKRTVGNTKRGWNGCCKAVQHVALEWWTWLAGCIYFRDVSKHWSVLKQGIRHLPFLEDPGYKDTIGMYMKGAWELFWKWVMDFLGEAVDCLLVAHSYFRAPPLGAKW